MTTIASTLSLFDSISRPLQNITQGMNMMIPTMYRMQSAAERNTNIDRTLTVAKERIAAAETDIRNSIEQATRAQDEFNRSAQDGSRHTDGLVSNIKSMSASYLNLQTAKEIGGASIGAAMKQQQILDTFISRTGSESLGTEIYEQITNQALNLGQDIDASLSGAMSFMSNTMDPGNLAQLNKLAMRLSKFNPAEGLGGAVFSLKEFMSGDYTSIAGRFNINRTMLQNSAARKAGLEGDVDAFIKGMDDLLNRQKMTEEAFEKMLNSPAAKWQRVINTFKYNMANAGRDSVVALVPLLDMVNQMFEDGRMQAFFNELSFVLTGVMKAVTEIVSGLSWMGGVIQNNWGIIEPIFVVIGASLTAWAVKQIPALVISLWKMVPPIAAAAKEWLLVNWPILLIGAAIGFLLYAMIKWGDKTVEVIGFVGGLFGVLFGFLYNRLAYFANEVLSVAEFFANVWRDPIYAVKKLFYDLAINSLEFMANIVKGIENLINKIPGLHIDITSGIDGLLNKLESARGSLKSEEGIVKLMRFKQKDYGEAFDMGRNIGKDIGSTAVNGVQETFNSLVNLFKVADSPEGAGRAGGDGYNNIDKVGEVGKIKDTVDIASEDLKIMRELAEMKNIQNFVTLTPTVSVTTGDIRNESDADTIVTKIKTMLERDIASSASAVYGI